MALRNTVERAISAVDEIKTKLSDYVQIPSNTPIEDYPDKIDDVYTYGKDKEYERFWASYQLGGSRTDYKCAFAGCCWTNDTLKPKYTIRPLNAANMFYYCGTRDNWIDFSQLDTDFSECTGMTSTFQNAYMRNINIDLSSVTSLWYTFQCNDGGHLDNITIKITDKCQSFNYAFANMPYLSTLKFTPDSTIAGSGINLAQSIYLSRDSIISIIAALSDNTTGKSITFSRTAVNNAFPNSDEWGYYVGLKANWTIALS